VTVLDPQTLDRPLRLTEDEATALVVAARALADVPGLAGRDALDRALIKVEKAVGASPADRVRVALDAWDGVFAVVQQALRERRRLHLRYLVWSRDEMTERDVDPMRVLWRDGHWYLEGWCHRAEAVRLFRLDRIDGPDGARVLDVPAAPPPQARSRDVTDGVYHRSADDVRVVLEVSAAARWVADYYPIDDVAELGDGRLRVVLFASELGWLRRMVLGLGADAGWWSPPCSPPTCPTWPPRRWRPTANPVRRHRRQRRRNDPTRPDRSRQPVRR
jgi:proteasome accessory factor C